MKSTITRILVERGEELFTAPQRYVEFSKEADANALLNDLDQHPHEVVLACVMDRQIKAERAWVIPHRIATALGGFSIATLSALSLGEIRLLLTKPENLHRFPEEMSRNFHSAVGRIVTVYGGDASNIWQGKPASAEVVLRFLQFRGVGPKIATMATNILARSFKVPLRDYFSIDISADIHVRRVFMRLGLVGDGAKLEEIIYRARALNPEFPGLMDFPAWEIGREWCHAKAPRCVECYMRAVGPSAWQEATTG